MGLRRNLVLAAALLVLATSCSKSSDPSRPAARSAAAARSAPAGRGAGFLGGNAGPVTGTLTVAVLPQLRGVLQFVDTGFEAQNPGAQVDIVAEPPPQLLEHARGNPPDLVVTVDAHVRQLPAVDGQPPKTAPFGRNPFVIVVPKGNPDAISDLRVFTAGSPKRVAICGPNGAYGNLAARVFAKAGITPRLPSLPVPCAKKVVDQVAAGSVDAGLLLRSGITDRSSDLDAIALDDKKNVVFRFSVATLKPGPVADAFVAFLQGETGRRILTERGYLP